MSDQQHQATTADVQARQPLPGTKIIGSALPGWYDGPPFAHVVLPDMTLHVTYRQIIEHGGQWPVHDSLGYGQPQVRGKGVRNYLRGSLRGWLFSEAAITDDGVIRYRHSELHSVIRLEPDPEAGVLIEHADRHVTAPAYRVTGPDGGTYLWSRRAMLAAVKSCLREKPVGWPDGWAHLKPTGAIHLEPGGAPWSPLQEWTAQPDHQAGDLGRLCADCGYHRTDHATGATNWFRYRRDKTGCSEWTAEPTR